MIFLPALRIMSTGLAELVEQGLGEMLLPFSPMQMQSLLGILSRFYRKQGRSSLQHCLLWLGQVVLQEVNALFSLLFFNVGSIQGYSAHKFCYFGSQVLGVTSDLEDEEALVIAH